MSYRVDYRGGKFHIKHNCERELASALFKYGQKMGYDMHDDDSIADLLHNLYWLVDYDNSGVIDEIMLDCETTVDEEDWFELIAPYVEEGSHVILEGEDGHIWCWYFDGQHCTPHVGEIVFPTIPKDRGEVKLCT